MLLFVHANYEMSLINLYSPPEKKNFTSSKHKIHFTEMEAQKENLRPAKLIVVAGSSGHPGKCSSKLFTIIDVSSSSNHC